MTAPYYSDEHVTIYHGDSREILLELQPLTTVDLVITDPPYGIDYLSKARKTTVTNEHGVDLLGKIANDTTDTFDTLVDAVIDAILPMLPEEAATYWFMAPLQLDTVMPMIRKVGLDIANLLVWDKGQATMGDLKTTYGRYWEAIIYARKGKPVLLGGRDRDVLRFLRGNSKEYLHPTQKPQNLLRYLISRHPSTMILDPFMGSGTTLRAAKDLNRKAIGIEIDEKYCDMAARRVAGMRRNWAQQAHILPLEPVI